MSEVRSRTPAGTNPTASAPQLGPVPAWPRASTSPATGKCLFSLLNLSNSNTVNFISEGCSCWIIYEPPVSTPKLPLCLPACVFAHTLRRGLVNQHIVKCLRMQRGGRTPPHDISAHIYLSLLYYTKIFLAGHGRC